MSAGNSSSWSTTVRNAALTLLLAVVVVFVAWQLLKQILVPLIVLLCVIGITRVALGAFRRDRW